jgi:transcription elongation factor GreB
LYSLQNNTEHTYRIVGKDELAPSMGYISWVSPLARALLGKQVGDVVKVVAPAGEDQYEIIDVQYQAPKP